MTNKEAIDLLENLIDTVNEYYGDDYDRALRMAIEALYEYEEEEPCKDCDHHCEKWAIHCCCAYCKRNFKGNPPCDSCDEPFDLQKEIKKDKPKKTKNERLTNAELIRRDILPYVTDFKIEKLYRDLGESKEFAALAVSWTLKRDGQSYYKIYSAEKLEKKRRRLCNYANPDSQYYDGTKWSAEDQVVQYQYVRYIITDISFKYFIGGHFWQQI